MTLEERVDYYYEHYYPHEAARLSFEDRKVAATESIAANLPDLIRLLGGRFPS